MSTFIIAAIIACAAALAIRSLIRKRKKRKEGQCSQGCDHCSGGCCH